MVNSVHDQCLPGSLRSCIKLGNGAEVLVGNDHAHDVTIIMGVGRRDSVAQFFSISGFVMVNIIDQFEVPRC